MMQGTHLATYIIAVFKVSKVISIHPTRLADYPNQSPSINRDLTIKFFEILFFRGRKGVTGRHFKNSLHEHKNKSVFTLFDLHG